MPATPKAKQPPTQAPRRRVDQTSAVVTTTLIVLTVLGVLTVFWEPLTALALGTPAADTVTEPRTATASDGGAASSPSPSTAASTAASTSNSPSASVDASGSS